MTKYERAVTALSEGRDHTMKVFGQSMIPIIKSGSALTFRKTDDYEVGDVVLSKVKGRWIDAHKITKIDANGRYLISNNKGWDWLRNEVAGYFRLRARRPMYWPFCSNG